MVQKGAPMQPLHNSVEMATLTLPMGNFLT